MQSHFRVRSVAFSTRCHIWRNEAVTQQVSGGTAELYRHRARVAAAPRGVAQSDRRVSAVRRDPARVPDVPPQPAQRDRRATACQRARKSAWATRQRRRHVDRLAQLDQLSNRGCSGRQHVAVTHDPFVLPSGCRHGHRSRTAGQWQGQGQGQGRQQGRQLITIMGV